MSEDPASNNQDYPQQRQTQNALIQTPASNNYSINMPDIRSPLPHVQQNIVPPPNVQQNFIPQPNLQQYVQFHFQQNLQNRDNSSNNLSMNNSNLN